MSYNVYQDDELIAENITGKEYTAEGLTPNTEYSFSISEVNGDVESEKSTITVKTKMSDVSSVEVAPKGHTMKVGESYKLIVTVNPSTAPQKVVWSSNKQAVATVDENGNVTGLTAGQVVITATAEGKTDSSTINVTPLVESVTVHPAASEIDVGVDHALTATVLPTGAVQHLTWKSSDAAIATVSNMGLVKGLKGGKVTITATAEGGKFGTATVDVVVPVEGISVTPKTHVTDEGEAGNLKLTHTIQPSNATHKTTTYSVAPTSPHVTVDNTGNLAWTADAPFGDYTVTAKVTKGGKVDTHVLTLSEVTEQGGDIEVESITLDEDDIALYEGTSKQLTATVLPTGAPQDVTWKSQDDSIATVVNGLVTAVSIGNVDITATAGSKSVKAQLMVIQEGE